MAEPGHTPTAGRDAAEALIARTDLEDRLDLLERENRRRLRWAAVVGVATLGILAAVAITTWATLRWIDAVGVATVILVELFAFWGWWWPVASDLDALRTELKRLSDPESAEP